jgi:hypothetical protein
MMMSVTPKPVFVSTTPAVGIFQKVSYTLFIDISALKEVASFGDCLTPAHGYYERGEEWQALGRNHVIAKAYPLAIETTDYENWCAAGLSKKPRGVTAFSIRIRNSSVLTISKKPDNSLASRTSKLLSEATCIASDEDRRTR